MTATRETIIARPMLMEYARCTNSIGAINRSIKVENLLFTVRTHKCG
jgi:hypothetical protein